MVTQSGTPLRKATYRTLHSIKRRAAGEHSVPVHVLVRAFSGEWMLNDVDVALLQLEVNKLEHSIATED